MTNAFVSSFGGSFFQWFQTDVLPYIIGTICILVFIATLILDIILIVTLKKRNMLKYPCNRFVLELAVMDLLAAFFIVIISAVVAFMKSWELGSYLCNSHAIAITWFYLVTFGILTLMFIERAVKVKKPELYERTFQSSRCVSILSISVWIVDLGISMIAMTDWVTVEYNFYHAACVVKYVDNIGYLCMVFLIGIGISTIVCVICYYHIFKTHVDKASEGKKKTENNEEGKSTNENSAVENKNPFAKPAASGSGGSKALAGMFGKGGNKGGTAAASGTGKTPKNKLALMAAKKKIKKAVTKAKVTKMFNLTDDKSDPEFHMAVTYFIVFCLMLVCYIPYFAINFADYNDKGEIWGGYYTITVILVMLSYCMKPIIYLSHNRHYRKGYKETLPEKAVAKATNIGQSINNALDKIEKAMFKTPGQKKLNTALNTHMAANKWLRKVKAKKGNAAGGKGIWGMKKKDADPNNAKQNPKATKAPPTNVDVETEPQNSNKHATKRPVVVAAVGHNARGTKPPITRQDSFGDYVEDAPQTVPPAPVRRMDSWGDFIDETEPPKCGSGKSNVGRRESMSPGSKMLAVGISNQPEPYNDPQTTKRSKMSSIDTNQYDNYPMNNDGLSNNYYDGTVERKMNLMNQVKEPAVAEPKSNDRGVLSLEFI